MKCPLCDSLEKCISNQCPGYRQGSSFSIYECSSCETSFVYPATVDEAIYGSIYQNIEDIHGYSRYAQYSRDVASTSAPLDYLADQEESYWAVTKRLRNIRRGGRNVKILEVGCGMGYFTYALSQDGVDITGLDIAKDAIISARNSFGDLFVCEELRE